MTDKRKYCFNGKLCTLCNSVWEITTTSGEAGKLIRYPDFPSLGLKRQYCAVCEKAKPDTTPDTLSEKATIQRQKLFIETVE